MYQRILQQKLVELSAQWSVIPSPDRVSRTKRHHPLRGAIFENMVVCEFLKDCYNHARKNNLSFYRDKSHEVDLIQEDAQGARAFEIKSAERFHPDFNKALKYLQSLLGSDLTSSQVVYAGQEQLLLPFCGLINYKSKFSDISK